jgi:hypothetical protein
VNSTFFIKNFKRIGADISSKTLQQFSTNFRKLTPPNREELAKWGKQTPPILKVEWLTPKTINCRIQFFKIILEDAQSRLILAEAPYTKMLSILNFIHRFHLTNGAKLAKVNFIGIFYADKAFVRDFIKNWFSRLSIKIEYKKEASNKKDYLQGFIFEQNPDLYNLKSLHKIITEEKAIEYLNWLKDFKKQRQLICFALYHSLMLLLDISLASKPSQSRLMFQLFLILFYTIQ